jgi:hypothetical protein
VAKQVELRVDGLAALLRDFRGLPKDATKELRRASVDIANRHMVPSWKAAALTAGNWGPKLAESIRARSDRLPALNVGKDRRAYRGGASTNMVRYPSAFGTRQDWAPFGDGHRLDGEAQAVPGASHPRVGPVRRPHRDEVE